MKDSNNIFELLNDIDFDIEDYKKEELTDIEKKKIKNSMQKNIRKKFNIKKICSIAVALVLTIGILSQTGVVQKVYADSQSKLSKISYSIGKAIGIGKDIESYTNIINKSVDSNGIEMKLTDVIIDKDELLLATIVDTGEALSMTDFDYKIFINGKRVINKGSSKVTRSIDDAESILSSIYRININNMDLTKDMDIRIIFSKLNYSVGNIQKEIKGKWQFEFNTNGKELMADTKTVFLDYIFDGDDVRYILEEFRYNPINQKIYGKIEGIKTGRSRYDIILKGKDNLGNLVEFDSGSRSSESFEFRRNRYDGDLSSEAMYITLAPYAKKFPEEEGQSYVGEWEQIGEEFTIFLSR